MVIESADTDAVHEWDLHASLTVMVSTQGISQRLPVSSVLNDQMEGGTLLIFTMIA